jgi:two-component system, OmpR family, phosphate regulon sensor histidine kinase PhoR
MDSNSHTELLSLLDQPALLIASERVEFANRAATELLGRHVLGENIRIALRAPAALELISKAESGRVQISGFAPSGGKWDIACHMLGDGQRLILLQDMSVQTSVARAHADFVANASHELRTPLAAILGYAETLMNPKAGDDPETRSRFLGTVQREAQRMLALVEDLMSLSRIEAVKHEVPDERVDLVALTRAAAGEAENGSITVDSNTPDALIAGDRGQIAQVLRNLIDNACKYGKPGGEVAIKLEASETGWICVSVHDDGDGIAPEHLPRLTERFYRADASRSRAAGGTGLGLSIVKHIIERHRGRFDIASRAGEGTTASFMLRLTED